MGRRGREKYGYTVVIHCNTIVVNTIYLTFLLHLLVKLKEVGTVNQRSKKIS